MASKNDETITTTIPSHCFLCISIAGGPPETVVIQLEREKLPMTTRNFSTLCAASGTTTRSNPLPTYRGCEFHRIVPKFMVQSGDFEGKKGSGGYSIYDGGTFKDEKMGVISHNAAGVVSMANRGKHTNGSQFFITLEAAPHLDDKHVAFGRVVKGMDVIRRMESVECDGTQPVAMQRIMIVDCGHGMGPSADDNDSDNSSSEDESVERRERKRQKKKRKKKHRSSSKKRRRRDYSESSSESSTSDCRDRRKKKKKSKRNKQKRSHYPSDSDDSSGRRRRRHKSKEKRRSKEHSS